MHKVKCLYCGEYFDADKEQYEKIGRRYAHKICPKQNPDQAKISQEERDKDNFYQMVK